MQDPQKYLPDWISESDAAKWLGITKAALRRMRSAHAFAYTTICEGKIVMYDRTQIVKMLNENSSYRSSGALELLSDARTIEGTQTQAIGAVGPDNRGNTSSPVERAGKPARASRMTMAQRRRYTRINLTNAHMRERGLI